MAMRQRNNVNSLSGAVHRKSVHYSHLQKIRTLVFPRLFWKYVVSKCPMLAMLPTRHCQRCRLGCFCRNTLVLVFYAEYSARYSRKTGGLIFRKQLYIFINNVHRIKVLDLSYSNIKVYWLESVHFGTQRYLMAHICFGRCLGSIKHQQFELDQSLPLQVETSVVWRWMWPAFHVESSGILVQHIWNWYRPI